jgi:hypothetical protein
LSDDLTRLRRKGLIGRLPGRNTYVLTLTASGSRCFTPSCTTASWAHSWPQIVHPRHQPYATPWRSSTTPSATTSAKPTSRSPENLEKPQNRNPQGTLVSPRRRQFPSGFLAATEGAYQQGQGQQRPSGSADAPNGELGPKRPLSGCPTDRRANQHI